MTRASTQRTCKETRIYKCTVSVSTGVSVNGRTQQLAKIEVHKRT